MRDHPVLSRRAARYSMLALALAACGAETKPTAAASPLDKDGDPAASHTSSVQTKARTGAAPVGKVVGIFIQPPLPRAREYTVNIVSRKPFQALRPGHDSEPQVARDFMAALEPAGHGGAAAPALLPR